MFGEGCGGGGEGGGGQASEGGFLGEEGGGQEGVLVGGDTGRAGVISRIRLSVIFPLLLVW